MANGYISKIKLPSGNTYIIKDEEARQLIAGGVSFNVAWDGNSTPVVANIPAGITVTYNGTSYTGTMNANDAQPGAFYLVKAGSGTNVYNEFVAIGEAPNKKWEQIGDTQVNIDNLGDLAYKNTVVVTNGMKTTGKVLGKDTIFSATGGKLTNTTKYLSASASGTTLNTTESDFITCLQTPKAEFVTSVSADTSKKLVTTSIVPTNGTCVVSKVTKTSSKLVTTTIPNVTGNTSVSIPNVTSCSNVTIPNVTGNSDATLTLNMGSGDDAETLIIGGTGFIQNTYTATITCLGDPLAASKITLGTPLSASKVTLGTAITAATGAVASNGTGSDIVTAVTIADKTVAKAGSAVTVATGAATTSGTGTAIVSDVTIGETAQAVTSVNSTTGSALIAASVKTQPTITLTTNTSKATGRICYVEKGTISDVYVSATCNDIVDAVTNIGNPTVKYN